MRCVECGERLPNANREVLLACPNCNAALVPHVERPVRVPDPATVSLVSTTEQTPSNVPRPTRQTAQATALPLPSRGVEGRIFSIDSTFTEPPDPDFCRWLMHVLWLLMAILSPIIALLAVLLFVGPLSAIVATVAGFFLLTFLLPRNIFVAVNILLNLRPGRQRAQEQIPVQYFRLLLRDTNERITVRLKGRLLSGNVALDDRLTCWGDWREGTLILRRAFNHSTGAWIAIQRSRYWIGLLLTICFIGLLIFLFYHPAYELDEEFSHFTHEISTPTRP